MQADRAGLWTGTFPKNTAPDNSNIDQLRSRHGGVAALFADSGRPIRKARR